VLFYGALSVFAVYLAVMQQVWKRLGPAEAAGSARR
jgi:hypothetical protein